MIVQLAQTGVALSPVLLVLLVVLAAAVGGLVLLINMFRRGGSSAVIAGIITAAVVLGVPVLLVTVVFFLRPSAAPVSQPTSHATATVRSIQHPADAAPTRRLSTGELVRTTTPEAIRLRVTPSAPTPHWQSATDLLPDATADLHPSRHEAEGALAAQLVHRYAPRKPIQLALTDKSVKSPGQTHHGLAQTIRELGVACSFAPPPGGPLSVHEHLKINLTLTLPTDDDPLGALTATTPSALDLHARFVEKPWLTNQTRRSHAMAHPNLSVVLHDRLETTEAAARAAALRAAANLIAPRLVGLRPTMGRYPIRHMVGEALDQHLIPRDQFTQRLDRPYGAVYRTALLIDLSPPALQKLAMQVNGWTPQPLADQTEESPSIQIETLTRTATRTYVSILFRLLGLGVLVGLTLLIYYALDRWTRGYRQGPLVITAVVVILGGAALLGLLSIA